MKRAEPTRFTDVPREFFEGDSWDPLDFLDDNEEEIKILDLEFMENLGQDAVRMLNTFDIESVDPQPSKMDGMEVGDDRVDKTRSSLKAACVLVAQEAFVHMTTSWPDTVISTLYWSFCEVTGTVPTSREQSFDRCRKSGNFEELGFTDVPPLRIILDVSKGDRSHSSTVPGKAAMLGNRMRTPRSEFLPDFYLASYLQDGCLRTDRSTEPKYLPHILGGSGVRAPFGRAENLFLYVRGYRGGEYQRIYGTATAELSECLNFLERGQATMPVLATRLRDKQEYLHGTYAEKVFIPSLPKMDEEMGRLPPPLIRASGGANRSTAFENRLLRTKHLVTRTEAVREFAFTTRIRDQLLSPLGVIESDTLLKLDRARGRERFGRALNANSAFSNLLNRNAGLKDVAALTGEDFLVVNTGVTHFTRMDAEWLHAGGKKQNFTIDDLTVSEDLYVRTEVSEEETFKIGGIPLNVISNSKRNLGTTTRIDVGLYQINGTMLQWADNLFSRLKNRRVGGQPLTAREAQEEYWKDSEWVNDDSGIIAQCLRLTEDLHGRSASVILVTNDVRLCNQAAQTCNCEVVRIPSENFILNQLKDNLPFQDVSEERKVTLMERVSRPSRRDHVSGIFFDSGSIAAAAAKLQQDDKLPNVYYEKQLVETGTNSVGKRFERYTLTKVNMNLPLNDRSYPPIQRAKRFRGLPGPLGSSSLRSSHPSASSKSWSEDRSSRGVNTTR